MATPLMLPSGPMFTAGNQIVDQYGNPVRIACAGWSGSGARNSAPEGLDQNSYQNILTAVKGLGFNCVRMMICDAAWTANDTIAAGYINATFNPGLTTSTYRQVFDALITYCGTIGLRVILDSHTNEGYDQGNQGNGLWYDKNIGSYTASDGTDGAGHTGTVTNTVWITMWQNIATRYLSYGAILGYDLRNEPNTTGPAGFGNGGGGSWATMSANGTITQTVASDYRAMYQTAGNAILAIDSRPLIICEGLQNYQQTFATGTYSDGVAYGTGSTYNGAAGDLSAVRTAPITLSNPAKLLYSAHEYPPDTYNDASNIAASSKVATMTAVWGWLVRNAVAPVWIGEVGSWFNGTTAQILSSTSWMTMFILYLTGQLPNTLTQRGACQAVGFDWWVISNDQNGGLVPDFGIFLDWTSLNPRTNQQALYNQLLWYGAAGTQPGTVASANGTAITGTTASITDLNGSVWKISTGGQVTFNGTADTATSTVTQLAWVSNAIWYRNAAGAWAYKQFQLDAWTSSAASPLAGGALMPSLNGQSVTTVGPALNDTQGNSYTLLAGSQLARNTVADTTLASVTQLAWVNGYIWALAGGTWYSKLLAADPWIASSLAPLQGSTSAPLTQHVRPGLTSWAASTAVSIGQRRHVNGGVYQCALAGTTAAVWGPVTNGWSVVDATARWRWLGNADHFALSGALWNLPTTFVSNVVWALWNDSTITTTPGTPFLTLSGHTTGSFGLTITGASGESIRDYLNSQSVPLAASSSNGVCLLQPSSAATGAYTVLVDPTVTLDGLQFIDPIAASTTRILQTNTGCTSLTVRNCIFDGTGQTSNPMLYLGGAASVTFANCLFVDRQAAGGSFATIQIAAGVNSGIKFVNCTFIAVNSPATGVPINNSGGVTGIIVRNCGFFGYGSTGCSNATFDHCASSSAAFAAGADGGSNVFNRVAATEFIAPGTDWRLLPGATQIDAGVIDTTNIPAADDITRTQRGQGGSWDIGCYERLAYGPADIRPAPIRFW